MSARMGREMRKGRIVGSRRGAATDVLAALHMQRAAMETAAGQPACLRSPRELNRGDSTCEAGTARARRARRQERTVDRGGRRAGSVGAAIRAKTKAVEAEYAPSGQFIDVDGVRLHYVVRGEGEPLAPAARKRQQRPRPRVLRPARPCRRALPGDRLRPAGSSATAADRARRSGRRTRRRACCTRRCSSSASAGRSSPGTRSARRSRSRWRCSFPTTCARWR